MAASVLAGRVGVFIFVIIASTPLMLEHRPVLQEPPQGFEPWTPALRKRCSTAELRRPIGAADAGILRAFATSIKAHRAGPHAPRTSAPGSTTAGRWTSATRRQTRR